MKRAVQIGGVLYSISTEMVKGNLLADPTVELAAVQLPEPSSRGIEPPLNIPWPAPVPIWPIMPVDPVRILPMPVGGIPIQLSPAPGETPRPVDPGSIPPERDDIDEPPDSAFEPIEPIEQHPVFGPELVPRGDPEIGPGTEVEVERVAFAILEASWPVEANNPAVEIVETRLLDATATANVSGDTTDIFLVVALVGLDGEANIPPTTAELPPVPSSIGLSVAHAYDETSHEPTAVPVPVETLELSLLDPFSVLDPLPVPTTLAEQIVALELLDDLLATEDGLLA